MPVISDQCKGVGMVSAMKRWLRVLCFEGRALLAVALFGGLLLGSAALGAAELQTATPESAGFDSERLTRLSTLAADYVDQGNLAGVVTLVNRGGKSFLPIPWATGPSTIRPRLTTPISFVFTQ